MDAGRGGSGLVAPRKDNDNTWVVERDILLGANVPGYPQGHRQPPAAVGDEGRR